MLLLRVGFILTGIVTVLLGQILPVLARKISLTDTEAGTLFIFQFAGSLAGTFCYSKLSAKLGYANVIVFSYGLMIIGLLLLNLDSWPAYAAAISIYGLGIGLNIPTTNMFVVELGHARSASGLSIVNFFWGFGAILCKPFVDLTGTTQSISIPVAILAALLFIMALLFGFSGYKKDKISDIDEPATSSFPIWTTSFAWMIAGFNFIHIGIESSVGGWITTYQDRLAGNSSAGILSAAAVFFVTLVAGRMLGPVFFRYAAENTVLFVSLIVMAIGTIVVLYAGSLGSLLLKAAVLGSGCSVVFPTNMLDLQEHLDRGQPGGRCPSLSWGAWEELLLHGWWVTCRQAQEI